MYISYPYIISLQISQDFANYLTTMFLSNSLHCGICALRYPLFKKLPHNALRSIIRYYFSRRSRRTYLHVRVEIHLKNFFIILTSEDLETQGETCDMNVRDNKKCN